MSEAATILAVTAVYRALIDQAHQRGLRVAAHLVDLDDAKGLVGAGVDVVAHSVRDQDVDAELIAELTRLDVGYIPTLTRNLAVFLYETTPAFLQRRVLPAGLFTRVTAGQMIATVKVIPFSVPAAALDEVAGLAAAETPPTDLSRPESRHWPELCANASA